MNLLESVLDEATKEGRVCPQPSNWNKIDIMRFGSNVRL